MFHSPMGRRFRARATKQHNFILPTEVPIPADKRNFVPDVEAADLRWYVCTTAPQQERRAAESLRREAGRLASWGVVPFVTYTPCDTFWQNRKRGALNLPRLEVQRPKLRSYLFVGAVGGLRAAHLGIMSERNIERQNKHGLLAVLGSACGTPMMLTGADRDFLARLAQQEREAGVYRKASDLTYSEGDTVNVMDGPFASYAGSVTGVDAKQSRLLVELTIFGRATPIELDFEQVARAA